MIKYIRIGSKFVLCFVRALVILLCMITASSCGRGRGGHRGGVHRAGAHRSSIHKHKTVIGSGGTVAHRIGNTNQAISTRGQLGRTVGNRFFPYGGTRKQRAH